MLGFGKNKTQPDTQIPYEVYETVREPANRRRQWIIRLVAIMAAVTLLIVGGTALVRSLRDSGSNEAGTSSETATPQPQDGGNQQGVAPQSAPSQPPAAPTPTPSPAPGSAAQPDANQLPTTGSNQTPVNDSTIRKPE